VVVKGGRKMPELMNNEMEKLRIASSIITSYLQRDHQLVVKDAEWEVVLKAAHYIIKHLN